MNASSMAANALAEDATERRRGPVVGGVVPSKVWCARHRDEAQPPAPQVLLGLIIIHTLDELIPSDRDQIKECLYINHYKVLMGAALLLLLKIKMRMIIG